MFTRCAHCKTVFRVTPQQLQASSGQVRCGRCENVFDAFASLSSKFPSPESGQPEAGETLAVTSVAPVDTMTGGAPDRPPAKTMYVQIARPSAALPLQVPGGEDDLPRPGEEDDERYSAEAPFAVVRRSSLEPDPPSLELSEDVIARPRKADPNGRRLRAASIGLGVLAVMQALWVFASPLANALPPLRPALEGVCTLLRCSVALPRLPDQLFIEASDLQMVTPGRPNEVLLTATIRNRAVAAQEWPRVELTLIAGANQTAARRVFRPEEYLPSKLQSQEGIAANQEVEIRLYLNTGTILPSGYRLFLFFA